MDSPAKLYVMEVGRDKDAPGGVFRLAPQQIPNAVDAPNDFPVAMQVNDCNAASTWRVVVLDTPYARE